MRSSRGVLIVKGSIPNGKGSLYQVLADIIFFDFYVYYLISTILIANGWGLNNYP